jgi:hypothetical protein
VGFAFEHFDGMGQYRDMENSKPIDSAGGYPFAEGYKTFANAGELMRAMADGEQAHTCYAKKVAGFACSATSSPRHADVDRAQDRQHGVGWLDQAGDAGAGAQSRVQDARWRYAVKRPPKIDEKWTTDVTSNGVAINRRRFLRGAGGVAIALPFLEGLPERSAWAQSAQPVFSLYIVAACGVVGKKFFPSATGALTTAASRARPTRRPACCRRTRANLLFIKGINFPLAGRRAAGTPGLCQSLTAAAPGERLDRVLGRHLRRHGGRQGREPERGRSADAVSRSKSYIAERISFKAAAPARCAPPI